MQRAPDPHSNPHPHPNPNQARAELEASRKELELSRSQAAGSDARSLQQAAELADAQQRAAAAESELIAVS